MNGALIGFGKSALSHLAAYIQMKNVAIKAVVDPVKSRREFAAEAIPGVQTFACIDAMFQHHKLDFIDICSPPESHCHYIERGLKNHCHVLCEKPLILRLEQYRDLRLLAHSVQRTIYPCHNYKFAPVLQKLSEAIRSGYLGQLMSAHFRIFRNGHAKGVAEWNPDWRRDPQIAGGGILIDHGTHSLYLACHLSTKQPLAVSCITGNLTQDPYHTTEDVALLTLDFGGMHWFIDLLWASNLRRSYYSLTGSQATITIEDDIIKSSVADGDILREKVVTDFDDPLRLSWFHAMFEDFLSTTVDAERQYDLLLESLTTLLIINRAYDSSKQGGAWVEIESGERHF
ncbi:MAG: Gfo/Idh/MocA family oxidoreductase [Acidobacteria bacterium]|nr:Gfo/Idh/MocA family oxidoreductase [Acidobacteriota bacterium]